MFDEAQHKDKKRHGVGELKGERGVKRRLELQLQTNTVLAAACRRRVQRTACTVEELLALTELSLSRDVHRAERRAAYHYLRCERMLQLSL